MSERTEQLQAITLAGLMLWLGAEIAALIVGLGFDQLLGLWVDGYERGQPLFWLVLFIILGSFGFLSWFYYTRLSFSDSADERKRAEYLKLVEQLNNGGRPKAAYIAGVEWILGWGKRIFDDPEAEASTAHSSWPELAAFAYDRCSDPDESTHGALSLR